MNTADETAPAGLDARRAALDLLERVRGGEALDDALGACRSFNDLAGPDRAFARTLTSHGLRRRGGIDHILGAYIDRPLPKKAARVMDVLRLAAVQSLILKTPDHAAVSTATALAHDRRETAGYAGLVNAVARKIAKAGPAQLEKVPSRADTPAWLWRSWERAFGPRAARAIADAHRHAPPLDLTVKIAADARDWAARLGADLLPPGTLRLRNVSDVAALEGYHDGAWWVQDLAASLPARLLGEVSGKKVFDLCAAPGGKTLQLAAAGAQVTAVDIAAPRLERLSENLARVGLAAETVAQDVLRWTPAEKADAVLIDAPCSATGTIRRHPDILWRKSETDIAALARLQAQLIDRAVAMLKPGGALVYCVCSLQPEEGERQAEAALARHRALRRVPADAEAIGGLPSAIDRHGDLRTLPFMLGQSGGMDGFFAFCARLAG